MKILVFSDSHGEVRHMEDAVRLEKPDHVIHLGDHVSDAQRLSRSFFTLPVLMIRGNCDFDLQCRESAIIELEGVRIMAVHGHRYGVKYDLLRYEMAARENNVDVALFGHTHRALCEEWNGLWMMNPGSCSSAGRPTYGVLELSEGAVSCRVCQC